jgi:hypothetical protein
MQGELNTVTTTLPIRILGINAVGEEADNNLMVAGRTLPWLQDTKSQDVWTKWKVTWRDVIVLDGDNKVAGIYNLTDHNLQTQANYDSLKALLVKVANQ